MKKFMTVEEVAEYMHLSPRHIQDLIRKKRLKAYQVSRRYYIESIDLIKYIKKKKPEDPLDKLNEINEALQELLEIERIRIRLELDAHQKDYELRFITDYNRTPDDPLPKPI